MAAAAPAAPLEGVKVETESGELSRLRAELAGALAEMETMKAVAEVSESTKAEAVAAVQRQCQEEVASLQAILKDSISSYEAQIASLKQERQQQQQDSEEKERELGHLKQLLARAHPLDSLEKQMEKVGVGVACVPLGLRKVLGGNRRPPGERSGGGRGCPSEPWVGPARVDAASLSIWLRGPGDDGTEPAGEGWPPLETETGLGLWQGRQLQKDLESVSRERDELQEGLRRSTEDCAKQMQVLLAQVQNSEQLLRTLQGTVSQAQERVQLQMVSAGDVWQEEEGEGIRWHQVPGRKAWASLEGQLRVQREETGEGPASSPAARRLTCAQLTDLLSEQRAKVLRLQAELETSEQVQRDFVRLSQALQVRLERIRQAGTLEQVRCILDEGSLKDVRDIKDT
uniref:Rab GTPase-binding effector protein 2 n=1 Tax=Ictidomys tridecemlineatus TaxID=43179 RepID=I3MTU8_ICTTR